MFGKFVSDKRGSLAITFALVAIVVVLAGGITIDFMRAIHIKAKVQTVADATALAANYDSNGLSSDAIIANAKTHFNAILEIPDGYSIVPEVTVAQGKITVSATIVMPTFFGSLAGVNYLDIGVSSETVIGKSSFDVVMVLDNSGSMAGSKISSLKTAAVKLSDTLLKINEVSEKKDRVKIGLVPFTSFVNVGAGNETASWMDREGRSPIHWTNFETRADGTVDPAEFDASALYNGRASRFSLYEQQQTNWLGCVESRPMPYDVSDTPASISDPATLFVPEFAVDEPSSVNGKNYDSYYNEWLDDDAGACKVTAKKAYSASGLPLHEYAQKRLCKYRNQPKRLSGWSRGPNYWCKTKPVIPLTTDRNTIVGAINGMVADGHTNIHQGVVWGWRVLSPQEPFVGGRDKPTDPFSDETHTRILIVMTDGDNTYQGQNSFNRTRINAYGYGAEQRLGNGIDTQGEIENKMDERTALACNNAKKDGEVEVYTVAFQISNTTTLNLMKNCATRADMAFNASSNSALIETFERIAEEISKLRLNR